MVIAGGGGGGGGTVVLVGASSVSSVLDSFKAAAIAMILIRIASRV